MNQLLIGITWRTVLIVVATMTSFPAAVAQTPDTPRTPAIGAMRVHERLTPQPIDWVHRSLDGPGGIRVEVMVPPTLAGRETDVVIHFHGPAWLLHRAVRSIEKPLIAVSISAPGLSSAYSVPFESPEVFDRLLIAVEDVVSEVHETETWIGRLTLSAFSAGYGAVRAIVTHPAHRQRVAAVMLLDGMHAGLLATEDPARGADARKVNPAHMAAFMEIAREALDTRKHFLITHSAIRTDTYASTTEAAQYLVQELGHEPDATVCPKNGSAMRRLSTLQRGGFAVLGFDGDTAADHLDHLHSLPKFLRMLMAMMDAPPGPPSGATPGEERF